MTNQKKDISLSHNQTTKITNIMKNKQQKIRDLAKDVAFLMVICGTTRGLALKQVGCTDENVQKVNDLVDYEVEFIRKEIEQ